MMLLLIPAWQQGQLFGQLEDADLYPQADMRSLTQTSHTSEECSKLSTGPALSSGILKINFATFSEEEL